VSNSCIIPCLISRALASFDSSNSISVSMSERTVAIAVSNMMLIATTALTTPTKTFRERCWRSPRAGAGYHAGSWVTSGLQQGFTRVLAGLRRRARLRNAKARLPCSPRAHGKGTTHSVERHAKHPLAHRARRWCTWPSVVPRPPLFEQQPAALLPPKTEVRSGRKCGWWCSAHQAAARGTRGAETSMPCPQGRNRHAFAAPGSRNFQAAAATLVCWTSPMAK
jgi:hypothetical protein